MDVWAVAAVTSILLAVIGFVYKYGKWQGEVNTDRANFKEFMTEIRDDIKKIFERLPTPAVSPGSPLRLTEYGEKLSDFLNAEKWASETANAVESKVKGKDAYQIQEFCNEYVSCKFQPSEEQAQTIRNCMFQHGATRTHVNEVLSLVLRDKLLVKLGLMHMAS